MSPAAKQTQERMTNMQCPHCGDPLESLAKRCPACGWRQSSQSRDAAPLRWPIWLIAGMAACLVLAGLVTAGIIVSRRARPDRPIVALPRTPEKTHPDHKNVDSNNEKSTEGKGEKDIGPTPEKEGASSSSGSEEPAAVHELLEQDSNTEIEGIKAELDIFGAIRDRNTAKVDKMLKDHPELANKRNYKGATPLHLAAALGDEVLASRLISRGADIRAECNLQMLAGQTPLHIAAGMNHTELMRMFLERGASANAKDKLGATPLHEAAAHGSLEAAELLLKSGAAIEARQIDGQTPLFWTAVGGNAKITRLLIENGADVNVHDYSELTPLSFAIAMNRREIAAVLRNKGGKE